MLHNKTTFGSRNASEGRFCVLHTVLIGLNDKFNEKVITYVRIKVIKGIVGQHIMQKGTNMDDMERLLTIKDIQEHLQIGRNRVYQLIKIDSFPKIKIGNTYRIPKQKYLEWIQNNIGKTVFL
ncbi:MAG: DNA-binding protein [Coprococcus catus]|nr:DNA-binding protein [Coprococcus catus]